MALTSEEEETIIHLAYQDGRIGTRLNPGTLLEKVNLFRPRMIGAATESSTITYGELTNDFHDLAWQDIGQVLGIIGLFEDEYDRPLLPAVVVNDDSSRDSMPGSMYFKMVNHANQYGNISSDAPHERRRSAWITHRDDVWAYDWRV